MSRMSVLNSPYLLGFDHVERLLDSVAKSANEGFPPYNIEQVGPARLRITLAVAGFTRADVSITLDDNQLLIRGKQTEDPNRTYLHRGIATRQFLRKFVLAEGMVVTSAHMDNGLLHIDLERPQPQNVVRTIEIQSGPAATQGRSQGTNPQGLGVSQEAGAANPAGKE